MEGLSSSHRFNWSRRCQGHLGNLGAGIWVLLLAIVFLLGAVVKDFQTPLGTNVGWGVLAVDIGMALIILASPGLRKRSRLAFLLFVLFNIRLILALLYHAFVYWPETYDPGNASTADANVIAWAAWDLAKAGFNPEGLWLPVGHPGFLYLPAVIYRIFGYNPIFLVLFNCLFSGIVMVQTYDLCVNLFSPKIATLSVLFLAMQPEFFFYSASTFKEAAIALLVILVWRRATCFAERQQLRILPVLALLAYLLYESRWSMAFVMMFCTIVLVFVRTTKRRRIVMWGIAAVGIIGGFLVLNLITGGVSHQLGDLSRDFYLLTDPGRYFELANASTPDAVTETSFSRLTSSSSLIGTLAWLPVRFVFTWLLQFPPIPKGSELRYYLLAFSGLMVQLLLPTAVVGIRHLWKKERAQIWTIVMPFAALTVLVGSGFAGFSSRYRTAIYPFFMILCAVGLYRGRKNTLVSIYVLCAIAAIVGIIVYIAYKSGLFL